LLIEYFNHDPAINWNGISCKPWEYYKDSYWTIILEQL
jgi:hypothetical protein